MDHVAQQYETIRFLIVSTEGSGDLNAHRTYTWTTEGSSRVKWAMAVTTMFKARRVYTDQRHVVSWLVWVQAGTPKGQPNLKGEIHGPRLCFTTLQ